MNLVTKDNTSLDEITVFTMKKMGHRRRYFLFTNQNDIILNFFSIPNDVVFTSEMK